LAGSVLLVCTSTFFSYSFLTINFVEEYEFSVPLGIQRPEGIAYINATHPSSEILGESAAALAAASVIFKTSNPEYSKRCIEAAKDLYTRGSTHLGTYMDSKDPNMVTLKGWYPSSIYTDELAWAASWIYVSTKEEKYLQEANGWIDKSTDHSTEVCCRASHIYYIASNIMLSSTHGTRSYPERIPSCTWRRRTKLTRLALRPI